MSDPLMSKSQFKIWFLIPLIVFLGLIVMFFARLGKDTNVVFDNALNRPVPEFNLPLLSNPDTNVTNADLPKTPFIINVWGSWCPTCYEEHPFFMELHQQQVPIVGVNYKDEIDDAHEYIQNGGDPYVFSFRDYDGSFAIDLGLTGAPESFIVDTQGNIRQHIVGEISADNWQSRIKPCMDLLTEMGQKQAALDTPEITNQIAEVCK